MPRVLHDIIEMVMDPDWLGDTDISVPQISVLKGLYGLPMRPEEREAFEGMTEGRKARKGGYFDATLCIGQRSGKTEKSSRANAGIGACPRRMSCVVGIFGKRSRYFCDTRL